MVQTLSHISPFTYLNNFTKSTIDELFIKISYKIKAPTFVDVLSVTPPTGLISNHLLKDLHDFDLLYKEIQSYQKSPSLN